MASARAARSRRAAAAAWRAVIASRSVCNAARVEDSSARSVVRAVCVVVVSADRLASAAAHVAAACFCRLDATEVASWVGEGVGVVCGDGAAGGPDGFAGCMQGALKGVGDGGGVCCFVVCVCWVRLEKE